ncbi:uncharacterized protein HMPREF1541_06476 [Cyphellophora europaea CBS 101466]|uniref:Uncharacterized protein n=1 Tax=Cyphellophora europaea (strain CBS 101466) TaxID=1220924 RepID=W2RPK8_CYPE1|nr:uncharacterized protein HMPREF1541_06476 [Cyphellophora europaea CBS 101466]ETN38441.1 hypothetical protein HMPREF1541_06476 [Cyphellophora europaea CBS 101466]
MTHHASLWLRLVPAIALSGATYHFNAFWYSQNPVPMAKQWNEAVEASNQLRTWLLVLAGAWWVVAVLALFG